MELANDPAQQSPLPGILRESIHRYLEEVELEEKDLYAAIAAQLALQNKLILCEKNAYFYNGEVMLIAVLKLLNGDLSVSFREITEMEQCNVLSSVSRNCNDIAGIAQYFQYYAERYDEDIHFKPAKEFKYAIPKQNRELNTELPLLKPSENEEYTANEKELEQIKQLQSQEIEVNADKALPLYNEQMVVEERTQQQNTLPQQNQEIQLELKQKSSPKASSPPFEPNTTQTKVNKKPNSDVVELNKSEAEVVDHIGKAAAKTTNLLKDSENGTTTSGEPAKRGRKAKDKALEEPVESKNQPFKDDDKELSGAEKESVRGRKKANEESTQMISPISTEEEPALPPVSAIPQIYWHQELLNEECATADENTVEEAKLGKEVKFNEKVIIFGGEETDLNGAIKSQAIFDDMCLGDGLTADYCATICATFDTALRELFNL